MDSLERSIEIANIHKTRIEAARERIQHLFPIKREDIENLSYDDLTWVEFYTGRFGRLHDLMGCRIFPELLLLYGEEIKDLFFIDRLNKLERLGIIEDVQDWLYIRKIRHQFSHDYPERPELLANNLNLAYEYGPSLLRCLARISQKLTA